MKKRTGSIIIVLLFGVLMLAVANRQNDYSQTWNEEIHEEKLSLKEKELLEPTKDFEVERLRVEFVENPVGLDITNPSFSWEMDSEKENTKQYAYRIEVCMQMSTPENGKEQVVWDSGFVRSDQTTGISYQGAPLQSHTSYTYTVTCVDDRLHYTTSHKAYFQTAYVKEQPFEQAKMICMRGEENVYDEGQAIFVKEFGIGEKPLKKATIYATALGIYDAYINGKRVGKDELKPGWSNYHKSLYYNTYDITELLICEESDDASYLSDKNADGSNREGEQLWNGNAKGASTKPVNEYKNNQNVRGDQRNQIAVMLGTGWWCGRVGFGTYDYHKPAFIATIRLEYEDGSVEEIHTDESWKYVKDTAVVWADIFNGEVYDGNKITTKEASELPMEQRANMDESKQAGHLGGQELKEAVVSKDFTGEYRSFYGYQVQHVETYDQKPVSAILYNDVVDNGTVYGAICYRNKENQIVEEQTADEPVAEESTAGQTTTEELTPKDISLPERDDWELLLKKGETLILDMGQNMTGVPYIQYSGEKGTEITLDFAEMLNDSGKKKRGNDGPKGSLYTANYRSAASELLLIAGEEEVEEYQPVFTYYGFRYLSVTATNDITIHNVIGKYIGNSSKETGYIKTDNELVNKLYENVAWTQRNNFLLVATDCPQRDERIGWTGDLQVFAKTSMYNQNLASFYQKWFQDVMDSQTEEGAYTDTVPATITVGAGNAGWADAGISVPYDYYKMYGDSKQLRTSYPSMKRYMNYVERISDFDPKQGRVGALTAFGDWLGIEDSDKELISTLYYAKDAMQMKEMAGILGKYKDAKSYEKLYAKIKKYFREKYMTNGEIKPEYRTQTVLVLAIAYDMLDENEKKVALEQLTKKIQSTGGTLSTGFLGTPVILKVLSENGKLEEAYQLLLQEKNPSWIYSILQGATTIWERYDSYTIKDGFADVAMNSFNHFNNGSVVQWMYENMLGIQMMQGEHQFSLCPGIILDNEIAPIHDVEGSYDSIYGQIYTSFEITQKKVVYQVQIPANCQAKLQLPIYKDGKSGEQIYAEWEFGSGSYKMVYDRQKNAWNLE